MKKVRLDLEQLAVESFEVGGETGQTGTVQGRDSWYTGCACPAPPPQSDTCTGDGHPGCTDRRTWCEPSCVIECPATG